MKPYRTSFLSIAAFMMILCSLSFFQTHSAKADCKFSVGTTDSVWSFSASAGATMTRTLTVKNTSDSVITITASIVTGSPNFGLAHEQYTLKPGESTDIIITFQPASNTTAASITGILRVATSNSDCRHYLTLVGTVTQVNHGGGDKVVTIDPGSYNFGTVAAGADTCRPFYLVNSTGAKVTITGLALLSSSDFRLDPAFNGTLSIDSGSYYRFTVCFKGDANHAEVTDSLLVTYLIGTEIHHAVADLIGHTGTTTTGGDVLVADPHEFSFGQVQSGTTVCKNVVVTNKGTAAAIITGWKQCDSKVFAVTPAFTGYDTLAAGASMTYSICYSPTGADSIANDCSITLNYSSSGDHTLAISFYGINPGTNAHNTVCLKTEQGQNYHDAIVVGGTADHTLYLINHSSHSITVNSASISGTDAGVFSIVSTLPITVPANTSTTTLEYQYAPTTTTKNEFNGLVTLSLSGDSVACTSVQGYLLGYTVHGSNTTDSVVRPLFPTEKRTLAIEGSANHKSSVNFYFTNNLTVDCTVNKIYMANGTYFTISSTTPTPTPFVLHPGDNLTVVVTYTATDQAVHHDSLMIDANHNLLAQSFDMQGLNLTASVPNALPSGVAINVSPNPASSYVNVNMAGILSADIQVIDLLGNITTTAKANTTWKWDAANFVSGSYIIRISGISGNGEQFVASKRVIVSK